MKRQESMGHPNSASWQDECVVRQMDPPSLYAEHEIKVQLDTTGIHVFKNSRAPPREAEALQERKRQERIEVKVPSCICSAVIAPPIVAKHASKMHSSITTFTAFPPIRIAPPRQL